MQQHSVSKLLIATAVGGWVAMSAATAFAQQTPQTANMSVTGTIVPAACSANFTGNGVVDYGTIRVIDLPVNAYYFLGVKDTELDVTCNATKRVTFTIDDLQSANAIRDAAMMTAVGFSGVNAAYLYGLGTAVAGGNSVNLGGYLIEVGAATIDGMSRAYMYSNNNGANWGSPPRLVAKEMISAGSGATPTTGTRFNFGLKIRAALNTGMALQVAQDTPLNGQAVFSINYQ